MHFFRKKEQGKASTPTGLKHDQQFLTRIVEHTPLAIIATEIDGSIRYCNHCALLMLGYERHELFASTLDKYLSGIENCISWNMLHETLLRGTTCETQINLVTKKQHDIHCTLNAFNIAKSVTDPQLLIFIFRDITKEHDTNDQLEKNHVEIARMNSELIRSNTELKRVSELKSNFLSIASHELKTPLTSIKGYSDIILDGMQHKLDPEIYRMIESINRAADRLHRVVNNILDVTRIEQKRLKLKPEEMDICQVARESIDELSHFSTQRDIKFVCDFKENLPFFFGDKMRMQQVFINLLSNALKYSPDHTVITLLIELNKTVEFHIAVKDCGIGIDKNEQSKIFDTFYEVASAMRHSTDSSKFMGGGTGLGLSIVKGIVERHGGSIWVESNGVSEGKFPGSEFHILLPLSSEISWDDDETRALLVTNEEERTAEEIQQLTDKKPTILFIDSDREAVEIASMILQSAFDILVAETGETGLTMAFTHRPSLVLMDSYLPGLDGYHICRILRSQQETRDIPIVFFSAGTQNDEIQKCFACGARDFIVKPFNGKELVDKIWQVLMRKKEINNRAL